MTGSIWDMLSKRSKSTTSSRSSSLGTMQKKAPSTTHSVHSDGVDVIPDLSTTSSEQDYRQTLGDVLVVGAGPSGLVLADNLVRFGIKTKIIDNRLDRTAAGRADGIQPKTIETLKQMRLAEPLLRKGVKIYDIAFWKSTAEKPMQRTGREIHYPPVVDLLEPYILLVHQGIVESTLIEDLRERGCEVVRDTAFVGYEETPRKVRPLTVSCMQGVGQASKTFGTRYVVGCDGAHSQVRKSIPNAVPIGASSDAVWGVLDGVLDTDFPDIWSKVVIHHHELGSVLMIPRERNMTRLYIELKPGAAETMGQKKHTQDFVQRRAQEILSPYRIQWRNVDWFGRYQIGQRIASRFSDDSLKVFIAGDASHTHSPKAAQGMNTSMHDSWNLAWKLNFAVRGLAKPCLLQTYELERRKIAEDLINFDYEHANAFAAGDPVALAANFEKNVAFISGYGVNYDFNILNVPSKSLGLGLLKPGYLLPPAKVIRYIDCNPVDIQTDIPALGQFRIYFFARDVHAAMPFLDAVCTAHGSSSSYVGRLTISGNASYTIQPPLASTHDQFVCPERYTPVSAVYTYALVTDMPQSAIELADLPVTLRESKWTFYLDSVPDMDTRKQKCIDKWLGGLSDGEVVVLNVRPDGYVGCSRRWPTGSRENGVEAVQWMDHYYEQFLNDI